jgi:PAS domain S-box-containing protein
MSPLKPNAPAAADHFPGGGEMGRRIREFDWAAHPLGPIECWPQSLKVTIRIMLTSRYAMWMGWGPEFYFFCNDAYAPTLGIKRDAALGESARKVWAEIWGDIGPRAESVVQTGRATWDESLRLFLERSGYAEETYHTFSYSPVPADDGAIGGMLCVVTEETERVIGARRLALLRELGTDLAATNSEQGLFQAIQLRLADHSEDLPLALIYLLSADQRAVRLACAHHAEGGAQVAPEEIGLGEPHQIWPVAELFAKGTALDVDDLSRFAALPSEPWEKPPRRARLVPIAQQGQEGPVGFLVAGINPFRPLDASYIGFLDLVAGQVASGLANARAYEAERRRAEALAEIDRAKTAFFSNVSHEFRTPLTLLLGPLEEIASKPEGEVFEDNRQLVEVAHRNGLRLLKLVNSLLDFSRLEAGRTRARFEPTDLATYTAELASSFHSAMEKAGLDFVVDCAPLTEPVHVDREMWEKIVLNLLSNAFKFTLEGEVRVTMRPSDNQVEFAVRDTGSGIPKEAQPHLFERFYRVEGTPGRSHEGSGIGLALVHELVKLHGGAIRVESEPGCGSAFMVTLQRGTAHLPADQCTTTSTEIAAPQRTAPFLAEALRWVGEEPMERWGDREIAHETESFSLSPLLRVSPSPPRLRPRILLADDNADMRTYMTRLLSPRFEITAVADGQAALDAARDEQPDLVLSDVMMPGLDGFALLRELRADPALRAVPLILLSARAGEEARIEGLEAGADDYLIKPFHARELLARVTGTLTLARVRAEAVAREAELRAERAEILEGMNLPFVAFDEEFRFSYLNAEAGRLHGLTVEKYLGKSFWESFPAVLGTELETRFREAMTERTPVRFDYYNTPSAQWFEINASPMSDGHLGVFFRDITERKNNDETLLANARQLRLIADTAPVLIAHCDREYRYKFVNEPYAARFKRQPSEVIGRRIPEIVGESAFASFREYVERVLKGEAVEFEMAIPYEVTGLHYMRCAYAPERDKHGTVVGLVAAIVDISERRRAELQLAEQARLLDLSFDAIFVRDAADRVTYWNKGAEAAYGFTREEALGRVKHELLRTEFPEPLESIRARLRRDGRWVGEVIHFHKDGARIVDATRWVLDRDAQGQPASILETNTDITERQRAAEALRQSEANYRGLIESLPAAVYTCDPEGRVQLFNAAAVDLWGREPEVGRTLWCGSWRIYQPDGSPLELGDCPMARTLREGRAVRGEEIIVERPDGSRRHVLPYPEPIFDAAGALIGAVNMLVDITERKLSELLLIEQRNLLERIAIDAPLDECLIALCIAVSRLNPRTRACIFLTDPEGKTFARAVAPVLPVTFSAAMKDAPVLEMGMGTCGAAVCSGEAVSSTDIATDARWASAWREVCLAHGIRACRSAPIVDAEGQAIGTLALCFDEAREPSEWELRFSEFGTHVASIVLERDRADRALREARDLAEAANRSKDRFLAVLSHELRTPLTPVLMAVAALERDLSLPAEVRDDLAMMRRNIELETKLIDDLLDLNRITSGKLALELESVELNEIVRRVCGICAPQGRERGVRLDTALDPKAGRVVADPARLQQVLWNVLRNATKFTPEGGSVTVSTSRLAPDRCEVRVRDTGIGIEPAALSRIFDAFEQADAGISRQFGGLGLGLAISKALVELHEGTIRAESTGPGRGATFLIELPSGAPPPVSATPPSSPPQTAPQEHPRLLLVEDHVDTSAALSRLLRRAGYQVTVAGDVATALAAAEREPFDVLVSDLGLPDGTGNDLMRRLREKRPVRGIAMSGFGMDEDQRCSREAGFAEHLVKPIDLPKLEEAIRRVMRKSA